MNSVISRLPLTGGTFIMMFPMMTTPVVVGALVDGAHLTGEQAGWIGTASIGAVAVTSILTPPLFQRWPGKVPPLLFAALVALGYAALGYGAGFGALLALSVVIGIGSGGLMASMAMRIAKTDHPDRIYGMVYAVASALFALLLFALPALGAALGARTQFLAIALTVLLAMPSLFWLGDDVAREQAVDVAGQGKPWGMIAILAAVMTIAFPLYGGVYAFSERRAVDVGLTPSMIGATLAAMTVLSVVGSLIVAGVGTRPGRTLPTMVVMAAATLSYALVLGATQPAWFIAGMLLFGLMQLALNSYFFGLASALDRDGHIAAALQGYSLIPYALGSGLLGSLASHGDFTRLAWPAALINIAAAALLLPALLRLDRRATA